MTPTLTSSSAMQSLLYSKMASLFPLNTPKIAVAVSGGADSIALCLMLRDYLKGSNTQLIALTVDHRLRPESQSEAQQVNTWLSDLGIEHHILTWDHSATNASQEMARETRYKLLVNYCYSHSIHTLFLGHHLNDQAETFLMRLSRSSGLVGLCGMQETLDFKGVSLCRPLLNTHPDALKEYLNQRSQPWIEDPSNSSDKYERNRLRKHAETLEKTGVAPAAIAKTTAKLNEANEALNWAAEQWIQTHAHLDQNLKFAACSWGLDDLPIEIARRIMLKIASFVRGKQISHKYIRNNLENPYKRLISKPFKAFTWGGCYWFQRKGKLYICREWEKCPTGQLPPNNLYDNRFYVPELSGKMVHAIGKKRWPDFKKVLSIKTLPREVFLSFPITVDSPSNITKVIQQNLSTHNT